jgi:hypothetical protein
MKDLLEIDYMWPMERIEIKNLQSTTKVHVLLNIQNITM